MEFISTEKAPGAIGPYSQAVKIGNFLFISGQIPLEAETMEIKGDDIIVQTQQVLTNIENILNSQGLFFSNLVKTTIYMNDMNNFSAMNEVYGEYFPDNPPARSAVEVSELPKGADIEIEVIAHH